MCMHIHDYITYIVYMYAFLKETDLMTYVWIIYIYVFNVIKKSVLLFLDWIVKKIVTTVCFLILVVKMFQVGKWGAVIVRPWSLPSVV